MPHLLLEPGATVKRTRKSKANARVLLRVVVVAAAAAAVVVAAEKQGGGISGGIEGAASRCLPSALIGSQPALIRLEPSLLQHHVSMDRPICWHSLVFRSPSPSPYPSLLLPLSPSHFHFLSISISRSSRVRLPSQRFRREPATKEAEATSAQTELSSWKMALTDGAIPHDSGSALRGEGTVDVSSLVNITSEPGAECMCSLVCLCVCACACLS